MDKTSILKEWFNYSERDISSAKYLLGMNPIPIEIICYHCEQAAEKMLKAYLIDHEIEPPKSHDLKYLCNLCISINSAFESISEICVELSMYSVQPRYPFEINISEIDMRNAIVDAEKIIEFVKSKFVRE